MRVIETLGTVLEEETDATIDEWLLRVRGEPHIFTTPLNDVDRSAHLPELFANLVHRLRHPLPLGARAAASLAASNHGLLRSRQGYSASMMIEESRILQVTIFQTLHNNLQRLDEKLVLLGVMAIADEVDSQLAQSMTSYISETGVGAGVDPG